mgnify:CR=1 FL=1
MKHLGFTMIELLIVIAILGVLLILSALLFPRYIAQAWDARRKDDLRRFQIALEAYFEDNGCYPDSSLLATCGSNALSPYLDTIMCDPRTNQPYTYVRSDCKTYRLFTRLEWDGDRAIDDLGCRNGCGSLLSGSDGSPDAVWENYGVSSSNVTIIGRFPICENPPTCNSPGSGGCCPSSTVCDNDRGYCRFE